MDLLVDSILAAAAVRAAVIECTIHVPLKVFSQTIQPVDGITQTAIVVAPVTTIVRITAAPLGRRCDRQRKGEYRRSEN